MSKCLFPMSMSKFQFSMIIIESQCQHFKSAMPNVIDSKKIHILIKLIWKKILAIYNNHKTAKEEKICNIIMINLIFVHLGLCNHLSTVLMMVG